jgi:hypothetical protein
MEGDKLRTEKVVSGWDARRDRDIDLSLVVDKTGHRPDTRGVEAVLVDFEPYEKEISMLLFARRVKDEGYI